MPQEIKIDGIGISPDVLTAIVSAKSRKRELEWCAAQWVRRPCPYSQGSRWGHRR